jgi:hypothetical protein
MENEKRRVKMGRRTKLIKEVKTEGNVEKNEMSIATKDLVIAGDDELKAIAINLFGGEVGLVVVEMETSSTADDEVPGLKHRAHGCIERALGDFVGLARIASTTICVDLVAFKSRHLSDSGWGGLTLVTPTKVEGDCATKDAWAGNDVHRQRAPYRQGVQT